MDKDKLIELNALRLKNKSLKKQRDDALRSTSTMVVKWNTEQEKSERYLKENRRLMELVFRLKKELDHTRTQRNTAIDLAEKAVERSNILAEEKKKFDAFIRQLKGTLFDEVDIVDKKVACFIHDPPVLR